MKPIELVYFTGCPNADNARANLRAGLEEAELEPRWTEWDQHDPGTPDRVRALGSPTVLVDGRDVTGVGPGEAAACRADGAPTVEQIVAALVEGA